MLKRVSRRYMLRNSAIAATGALILPSYLTSCKKEDVPNRGSVGSAPQLSTADLALAAANLTRMRTWFTELYPLCIEYEDAVFHALASTKINSSWTNFIIDIFLDIAVAMAAAAAISSGAAGAVPGFAFISSILHDWGLGKDIPTDLLDAEFASFEFGHVRMQFALEQQLSHLVDPKNNYANLVAAWTQDIDFNNGTYNIGDLAASSFPALGDDYNALQAAAIINFQSALWKLVIMKCCTYQPWSTWNKRFYYDIENDKANDQWRDLLAYAREVMYPQNKGRYLRAMVYDLGDRSKRIYMQSWSLGIGGNQFPDEACNQLFKDDTPGNNKYNPNGLFNRTYVFQQFALKKPTLLLKDGNGVNWYDLGTDYPSQDIDLNSNDWVFPLGMFKKLIG